MRTKKEMIDEILNTCAWNEATKSKHFKKCMRSDYDRVWTLYTAWDMGGRKSSEFFVSVI